MTTAEALSSSTRALVSLALLVTLALIVPISGYLYATVEYDVQLQDRTMRLVVQLGLFAIASACLLLTLQVSRRAMTLLAPIALVIGYMLAISVMRNAPDAWVPATIRWATYLMVFLIAFSLRDSERLLFRVVAISTVIYLAQILSDMATGRMIFLNSMYRAYGAVGSPIGLASTLYVLLLFWHSRIIATRGALVPTLISLAVVAGIFFTGTRSTFALASVATALALVLSRRSVVTRATYIVMIAAISIVGIAYLLIDSPLMQRILRATTDVDADASTSFRLWMLQVIRFNADPLDIVMGVGLGGFPDWFEAATGVPNVGPHYEIVWLIMEGGVAGTLIYGFALVQVLRLALRSKVPLAARYLCAMAVSAQMTGLQFGNPTYFYQTMMPLALLIAHALRAVDATGHQRSSAATSDPTRAPARAAPLAHGGS